MWQDKFFTNFIILGHIFFESFPMILIPYQISILLFKTRDLLWSSVLIAANLFRKCVLPEKSNLNDKALSLLA